LGETRKGEVVQQVSEWVSEMASDLGTLASSEPEEEEESGTPEEVGAGLQMREGGGGGEHPAVDDSSISVGERIVLIPLEHTQSVLAFGKHHRERVFFWYVSFERLGSWVRSRWWLWSWWN
jgi:hypothetical protein